MNEAYIGIFLVSVAALSACSKLWHSQNTTTLKALGTLGSLFFFAYAITSTIGFMDDRPWSNVPAFFNRFVFLAKLPKSGVLRPPAYPPTIEQPKIPVTEAPPEHSVTQRITRTEVALEFAGRDSLRIQLANTTINSAEKPKYWFNLVDATNCFVWPQKPDDCQPLPIQAMTYSDDYIDSAGRLGPYDVLSLSPSEIAKQHVKKGDVIVGAIATTCFNCLTERKYYIYFKVGEGGWFYPVKDDPSNIRIPYTKLKNIPDPILEEFLRTQVPHGRIAIPEQFDYKRKTATLP